MTGRERVSVVEGVLPLLVVSPHWDDQYTDVIAETIANKIKCYAVINRGWERADKVDTENDKANCNSIPHCYEDVVKEEFLDPIWRYMGRSHKTIMATRGGLTPFLQQPFLITIHGIGDQVRTQVKDTDLDFVLGTGAGKPDRPTCQTWRKNALAWGLINKGIHVWTGKAGSPFAAWGKDNLTQLFNQKGGVGESIQIEIIRSPWRDGEKRAKVTGNILADVLIDLIKMPDMKQFTGDFGIPSC